MSISRKNWSALSSLARQWTMEDEEEVEREERRRRRGKSSSSTADPDATTDAATGGITSGGDTRTSGSPAGTETSQGLSSEEQMQLDFVEMLRVRDEKRRLRHVETLRRQKQEEEEEEEADGEVVVGGVARNMGEEEEDSVFPSVKTTHKQPPQKTSASRNSSAVTDVTNRQENGESRRKESDPRPASSPVSSLVSSPVSSPVSRPARKFVSSVSISLDKSPSISGRSTPMSPRSPTAPMSPREHCSSPCQSPPPGGAQSPVQNGHTQETGRNVSLSNGGAEQTSRPGLVRQSSRTVSFRMMRKKEEETSPLHRSASVRVATKKFETNTDQNEDEEKTSSFTRNSRQRISSRSIQEKMERLAQAAQKSETTRCADVSQRTLFLLEEVSRKRGIFEKDEQKETSSSSSSSSSRQDFRSLRSGMSDRINRWINKSNQSGPAHGPTADLRHVDISSKRSMFENRGQNGGGDVSKTVNIYK
ncbi:hypothetical protein JOB18_014840 [Solea senegalensis]|uniref:Ladinin-1 n=1 Tax=Solea senegalensis TaxID=28829 RepID=A0AAV6SQB9_SOLSE|nr:ladinin-1 [Solea senegalensis]KAG7519723.1 hypothetical protein JOB18_014840 [Solea senegalensis]